MTSGSERKVAESVDAERARVQRRTLRVVVLSQVLGGAGLAAGVTVGALLAQEMLGSDSLAGIPSALFTLGSALTAFLVGRLSQRWGRRVGLGAGFAAGGLGAVGVVVAAVGGSSVLLFVVAVRVRRRDRDQPAGPLRRHRPRAARATRHRDQRRDGVDHDRRGGRSESRGATRPARDALGIPALAGPFLLAAVAYGAASLALCTLLRPDPYLFARSLARPDRGPIP